MNRGLGVSMFQALDEKGASQGAGEGPDSRVENVEASLHIQGDHLDSRLRKDPEVAPAGGDRTGTSGGNTQRAEQTRTTQSAGNKHGAQQ